MSKILYIDKPKGITSFDLCFNFEEKADDQRIKRFLFITQKFTIAENQFLWFSAFF